jgi:uncharacterized protein YacL
MPSRLGRVVTITFSIALIGALIGATVGAILLALWSLPFAFLRGNQLIPDATVGAIAGGLLGGVLAPVTAWTVLRRVPLGKALLQTTLGTTVGAAIGLVFDRLGVAPVYSVPMGFVGALAGFIVAALRLWLATRTSRRSEGMQASGPGGPI